MRSDVSTNPRIIVALDYPDPAPALALADRLDPARCRLKVGKELFTRAGPSVVTELERRGFDVFLDLKFHDIPNTVAQACRAAAELGVWMVNVHAQGGRKMLSAAREAVQATGDHAVEASSGRIAKNSRWRRAIMGLCMARSVVARPPGVKREILSTIDRVS